MDFPLYFQIFGCRGRLHFLEIDHYIFRVLGPIIAIFQHDSHQKSKQQFIFTTPRLFYRRGWFGLLVELHREGSASTACAAGLFFSLYKYFLCWFFWGNVNCTASCSTVAEYKQWVQITGHFTNEHSQPGNWSKMWQSSKPPLFVSGVPLI